MVKQAKQSCASFRSRGRCDCCRQFTASVKGVGFVPASPRVLWAGIDEGRYDIWPWHALCPPLESFRQAVCSSYYSGQGTQRKSFLEDFIRNEGLYDREIPG